MAKKIKTTLITTVLNEERTISLFLDSVKKQTAKVDEVIIVDGGSVDNTVNIVNRYRQKVKSLRIQFYIYKGNRSQGRNYAIKKAKSNIILCTDVGCILDKNWASKIIKPFYSARTDVVSGFYRPRTRSIFEKCLSTYTCTMPDKVNPENFLPSSRSVAFKKKAWKEVGGYPEYLDTCEDLVFDKKLKGKKFNFKFQKDAYVWWPQRKNIYEAFLQFLSYAKGDGRARYIRRQVPLIYARYVFGFFLLYFAVINSFYFLYILITVAFVLYLLWAVLKNYKYVNESAAFLYLPILQIISDFAVLIGTTYGLAVYLVSSGTKRSEK